MSNHNFMLHLLYDRERGKEREETYLYWSTVNMKKDGIRN